MSDDMVPLADYSAALDEIYELRARLAYEALVTKAHIGYKTFPKGRRLAAINQIERMRALARGEWRQHPVRSSATRHALREAGASETLTRAAWEAER